MDDPVFEKIWTDIDVNESGYVSFEEFLDFMTAQMVDQDTAAQVMASFKVLAGEKVSTHDFEVIVKDMLLVNTLDHLCMHTLCIWLEPNQCINWRFSVTCL